MSTLYDFNQRVHLRCDPSQYGRIGVGMFGGNLDASGTCQFVFWEHEGADLVTCEPIVDLMSEEEHASIQVMERLYDAVQTLLDEEEKQA